MERVDLAMNPSQIEYFIGLYRDQEHLWNSRHQCYNMRSARTLALHEIASKMGDGWTAQLVKMKWHDLKSNYMREKRKSRESIRSETSEKFTPSWWLFGLMDSFLGPIYEEKRNSMINNNTIQQVSNQNIMEENEYNWSQEEDTKNFIINLNADKLSYNTGNADCLAQDTHTMFTVEQNAQTAATTSHKSSLPIRRNKLKNLHRMEHNSLETITNNNRLLQELQGSLTPAIEEDPDDIFAKLIGFELKKIRSDILKSELKLEIMSICHKFHIKQREEAAH